VRQSRTNQLGRSAVTLSKCGLNRVTFWPTAAHHLRSTATHELQQDTASSKQNSNSSKVAVAASVAAASRYGQNDSKESSKHKSVLTQRAPRGCWSVCYGIHALLQDHLAVCAQPLQDTRRST
jgi:hypothetical protein